MKNGKWKVFSMYNIRGEKMKHHKNLLEGTERSRGEERKIKVGGGKQKKLKRKISRRQLES